MPLAASLAVRVACAVGKQQTRTMEVSHVEPLGHGWGPLGSSLRDPILAQHHNPNEGAEKVIGIYTFEQQRFRSCICVLLAVHL